jgi:small subunit ribosomal protein S1
MSINGRLADPRPAAESRGDRPLSRVPSGHVGADEEADMNGSPERSERQRRLRALRVGQAIDGTVRSVENYGVLVDIGGIDGLVTVPNLSWRHFEHPVEIARPGDRVSVVVLSVDLDREQVSLSMKDPQADPFRRLAELSGTATVRGRVTKLAGIGAFVRIAQDIEGLVPLHEFGATDLADLERSVHVDQEVAVQVVRSDAATRRVILRLAPS